MRADVDVAVDAAAGYFATLGLTAHRLPRDELDAFPIGVVFEAVHADHKPAVRSRQVRPQAGLVVDDSHTGADDAVDGLIGIELSPAQSALVHGDEVIEGTRLQVRSLHERR